jgi:hypothetical protein
MIHESVTPCLFCHASLKLDDLAVYRDGARIAHVQCWRPRKSHPVNEIGAIGSSGQPNGLTPALPPAPASSVPAADGAVAYGGPERPDLN